MKSRLMMCLAALALIAAVPAGAGPADPTGTASLLALESVALDAPVTMPIVYRGFAQPPPDEGTRLEGIRYYRPRSRRSRESDEDRKPSQSGYMQLHGGFFDPKGNVSNGALFGVRLGTSIDDRVQLGVMADWSHRSDRQSQVIVVDPLPGGGTVERTVDLASTSADLFPLMVFLQVTPGGGSGLYFGVAGGYEALFVDAEDFNTGADYEATFDGWGWQAYGGMAIPMGRTTRLNIEGFLNQGELDREVEDPSVAQTVREIVNVDGAGLRAGLSWSF